jgi:quercetin dioxygenase-like cupin family protein
MTTAAVRAFDLGDVRLEQVTPRLSRKVVAGDRVMIGHVWMTGDCVVPRHAHEAEQHTYVFSGGLEFLVHGETFVVTPGCALVIPSGVEHQAVALGPTFEMDVFSPIRYEWLDGTFSFSPATPASGAELGRAATAGNAARLHRIDDGHARAGAVEAGHRMLVGDRVGTAFLELARGAPLKADRTSVEHLFWVRSGSVRMVVAGEPIELRPGSVLRVPAGTPYAGTATEDASVVDCFA